MDARAPKHLDGVGMYDSLLFTAQDKNLKLRLDRLHAWTRLTKKAETLLECRLIFSGCALLLYARCRSTCV